MAAGARRHDGDFALPVGTVTLLLADVEGSTRLWEDDPDAMAEASARLDETVNELLARRGGARPLEQGEGDSFVAAFSRASDAVGAGLDLQRADSGPIRLRVGIHTGEVQLRDDGNYVGIAMNRAARLRDLAHGGQAVVSGTTHDLVVDRLPDGCSLVDLGTHRLRDLTRPERVYHLTHPDLRSEFPPLRSLDAFAHNLPVQLTTFIGRTAEVAEVTALVQQHRHVTLTGSGGCGKTRLALQVAADLVGSFPDGVWVAELAPIVDPALVGRVVLRAVDLRDEPFRSAVETVTHHMAGARSLVVLDNCEHVVGEAAAVAEALLRSCPSVRVLATSREPLGVAGEVTWRVPSMSLPASATEPAPIDGVTASEAVALFVERARQARPGFAPDAANADSITEICRRLDGIPLAIELAAARVRVLSPDRIAATLGDAFRILAGGARTAVPRQQTLRASIEWSHELLSEPERTLLRRLGVLAGSFDLEAAEAVGTGDRLGAHHVLDQLTLLVDKSLVLADDDDAGEVRYRLLETVRQYAMERLETAGEVEATLLRHRDHYLAFAESPDLYESEQPYPPDWLDRMEAAFDDLRAAAVWSRARGDHGEALRLACALSWPATERGRAAEVHGWLEEAVAEAAAVDSVTRARALTTVAWNRWLDNVPGELPFAQEAVDLLRDTNDERTLSAALAALAHGRFSARLEYRSVLDEALAIARRTGDPLGLRWVLGAATACTIADDPRAAIAWAKEQEELGRRLGHGLLVRGAMVARAITRLSTGPYDKACELLGRAIADADEARDAYYKAFGSAFEAVALAMRGRTAEGRRAADRSIGLARDIGMVPLAGTAWTARGCAAVVSGELEGALPTMAEGWPYVALVSPAAEAHLAFWIELALATGDIGMAHDLVEQARPLGTNVRWYRALLDLGEARLALVEGDTQLAEGLAHEALATWSDQRAWAHAPHAFDLLGQVAAERENYEEATRLMGAATSLHEAMASVRFATRLADYDRTVADCRAALGDERFAAAWEEGTALSAEDAAAYAARGRGERKRPTAGWDSLTPAEREVVALVAEGLSNKEVAARLFVSPRTVQTHLTHVYGKLGLSSRVQLAQEASRRGAREASRRGAPPGS